jgi:DNA invertase Pin-like site-specific DNA recombinase
MSKKARYIAIYLRKSREDTESREETLARHERILRDFCSRNNLIIKEVYKEVVSGENLDDRPVARQLLEDVESGLYDGVVVIELERLSRGNQIDQVEITEIFKNSKTLIYTLNKTYDLSSEDEFDEDFFEFGLFMSRREYKAIKRRLVRGKKQAQKEGYYIGSALPYGFGKIRADRGYVLVPNEETPLVQMIFNKFVYENYSLADLRHYLESSGIKPRRSDIWSSVVLKNILKNKCYVGYINYNSRSRRTQECYKGKHEPIIDIETFNLAQEKLQLKSCKLKKGSELTNPLSSLVKCGVCGSTMQKFNEYYKCYKSCGCVLSYFDVVEKKVIEELKNELSNFNYFIENYGQEMELKKINQEKELELLNKELSKRDNMLNKACEMLELGVYSKEKYLQRVNILEEEKNDIWANIRKLEATNLDENIRIKKAIPILEKVLDEYWNLSAQEKNDLLKAIIDKIEYTKTTRNNRWHKDLDDLTLKIFLKI